MISNPDSGTRIDEIAAGIYRISTPVPPSAFPGGFSFNQYLVVDDEPLLFHSGMRSLFPLVTQAIERVLPVSTLRYIGLSHFESDECGALNMFLEAAPHAVPVSSRLAAMLSVDDFALRPARGLAGGEQLSLGQHAVTWVDAPHLPHNWETGYLWHAHTQTLLCGDLFTHGGHDRPPLVDGDLVEPAEAFRKAGLQAGDPDAFSHGPTDDAILASMAALQPRTLAVMHGSAWSGRPADGAAMLRDLSSALRA